MKQQLLRRVVHILKYKYPLLPHVFLCLVLFLFSFWIFSLSFSYQHSEMLISTKIWSDFGAHIPMMRYFSKGNIIPLEYPLFSGKPIQYHFLLYFIAGMMEKAGLNLAFSINFLGAVGFTALLYGVFRITSYFFKSYFPGCIAIILVLFNGSLSFLEFFRTYPINKTTFFTIIHAKEFASFAPWGKGAVSAFWTLNVFINQRHLAWGIFMTLLFLWPLLTYAERKKSLRMIGTILVVLSMFFPLLNTAVFVMTVIICGFWFLFHPKSIVTVGPIYLLSLLAALPTFFWLGMTKTSQVAFNPGAFAQSHDWQSWIIYWWNNFGLYSILAPFLLFWGKKQYKILLLSVFPLFILANIFQFSPELYANHKFFNLFLLIVQIGTAGFLWTLLRINALGKVITSLLVFFLTFSGLIDFFPILHNDYARIQNSPDSEIVSWIESNTPTNAVFMNTTYMYNPASLAGRKILLGWPYFPWSAGYDTDQRKKDMRMFFDSAHHRQLFCSKTKQLQSDYIITSSTSSDLYQDKTAEPLLPYPIIFSTNEYQVYDLHRICQE